LVLVAGELRVGELRVGGVVVASVQAVTPKPTTASARAVRVRRAPERFIMGPFYASGKSWQFFLQSLSPGPPRLRTHPRCGVRPP
jgi:hypothetical protein